MKDKQPKYITLRCRVLDIRLTNSELWPWTPRKGQLFKSLLRRWGLVIESHSEEMPEKEETKMGELNS